MQKQRERLGIWYMVEERKILLPWPEEQKDAYQNIKSFTYEQSSEVMWSFISEEFFRKTNFGCWLVA